MDLKLTTAEKKLILVFAYYIVFGVLALVLFSVTFRDLDEFRDSVTDYFVCEAFGEDPDNPCPRDYEDFRHRDLESAVYLLMGFIPVVSLVFIINIESVKKGVKTLTQLFSTTATASVSSDQTP